MRARIARGGVGARSAAWSGRIAPCNAANIRAQSSRSSQRAAVEGVVPAVIDRRFANQEVARHADPQHLDAVPARDFDQQHRQRDRDAAPSLDDRVEERVARVAVVVGVAAEPFGDEQQRAHAFERRFRARGREGVEARAPLVDIEARLRIGACAGGDAERSFVEANVGLRRARTMLAKRSAGSIGGDGTRPVRPASRR